MSMKQSVPGLIDSAGEILRKNRKENGGYYAAGLVDLAKHLRELRDRYRAGDRGVVDEFFELYVFGDEPSQTQIDEANRLLDQGLTAPKTIAERLGLSLTIVKRLANRARMRRAKQREGK